MNRSYVNAILTLLVMAAIAGTTAATLAYGREGAINALWTVCVCSLIAAAFTWLSGI